MLLAHTITSTYYSILGIIGIAFLIALHEFGHFTMAKLSGVKTPSFSIGFGPTLFEKKIGETNFKISAIPLGGYVEIAGMEEIAQGEQKEAKSQEKNSFAVKPYYKKMLILLGGVIFNLLFAYAAMTLLFSTGIPSTPLLYPKNVQSTMISSVAENSPASKAGIQKGDIITEINEAKIKNNVPQLLEIIAKTDPKKPITLKFLRKNKEQESKITTTEEERKKLKGRLGIGFHFSEIPPKGLSNSISASISYVNSTIKMMVKFLASLFKERKTTGIGGPIRIISEMKTSAEQGFKIWLILLVLISINLAIINLLPLPILDGGQAILVTIETALGRAIPTIIKRAIQYISWMFILFLIIYFSIKDIGHLLGF